MLSLYDIQKQFIDGLQSESHPVLNHIRQSNKLTAAEHLAIYQNSIVGAKQKVLKEIYPVCNKLISDDFFIAMINQYIPETDSQSPDIGHYGQSLPEFIAEFKPAQSLPYLSDVARLELAWHQLYSAPIPKGIDFEKLSQCYIEHGEKIIFQLAPNSTLISSRYPIHLIWEVNQDHYAGEQTIVLPENAQFNLFIWRKGLEMRIDLLDRPEWQVLSWMQAKYSLGDICQKFDTMFSSADITALLPGMVSSGWLASFDIP